MEAGPHTFVATDVVVSKVGQSGREIMGPQVTSTEDGAGGWRASVDLTAHRLLGLTLLTSDAHQALVAAIGATSPAASGRR